MKIAQPIRMTAEEYLVWSEDQPKGKRYELHAGEVYAQASERNAHSLTKLNCTIALREAVKKSGRDCTVFGDGLSLVVDEGTVYEPDAAVHCGPFDMEALTVDNPVVVVEVLSPSTKHIDSGMKLAGYFRIPSVNHYLIINPADRRVIHHARDGEKIATTFVNEGMLDLDGFEVVLADMFADSPEG